MYRCPVVQKGARRALRHTEGARRARNASEITAVRIVPEIEIESLGFNEEDDPWLFFGRLGVLMHFIDIAFPG